MPGSATPDPATGTTTGLSVLGADDGGESNLTYTWTTTGTPPAPVTFSDNGDNSAKNTTATFAMAGTYDFLVTITDAGGLSVTSAASVTVAQTVRSVTVSPSSTAITFGSSQQFSATALDQFGVAMSSQPAFTWLVASGGGSVSSSGLYTAPASATRATVSATASAVSGSASIAVVSSIDTLVVDTTTDVVDGNTSSDSAPLASRGADGKISLREAITAADNSSGLTEIEFNIPGGGTQTIAPASALPAITNPVIVDATTQPGYSGTPLVQISGASAGAGANGVKLSGGNSTVEGLAIDHFPGGAGILIQSAGDDTIAANYLGTNAAGTAAAANEYGIYVGSGAGGNTIGGSTAGEGNLISGNSVDGILLDPTTSNNLVQGNKMGTDAAGTAAIGNGTGTVVQGPANTIGGSTPADRNVISGNGAYGIEVIGTGANNSIEGNYIGTDVTGAAALGNSGIGVMIQTAGNTLGGGLAGAGNVISGNGDAGVRLTGSLATGNFVQGNCIGVNAAGNGALGNAKWGVLLDNGADNNFVGTNGDGVDDATEGNVIAASAIDANVSVQLATGNVIAGNFVGTNADGSVALGGATGIWVTSSSANTRIGTNADGISDSEERNIISGNSGSGILVDGTSTSTVIAGNYIGAGATGLNALGNGYGGIIVDGSATGTVIGGNSAVAGNLISGNSVCGVEISGSGSNALVQGNSIANNIGPGVAAANGASGVDLSQGSYFHNTGPGIDLNNDGVTANTGSKNAGLANDGMNFPVFTSTLLNGTTLTVAGYIGSAANEAAFANARVEVFQADRNSTGFGQGQSYLGYLTADANGNFSGSMNASGLVRGDYLTATATDASGNTSEFGPNFNSNGPPTVATAASATPNPASGTTINLSVLGADAGGAATLTYTWATTGQAPAPVTFSDNGTNSAGNTTATFTEAGTYAFSVTITDAAGLSSTSSVTVRVAQTLSSITVSPSPVMVDADDQQQFSAVGYDQFGQMMSVEPAFAWAVSHGPALSRLRVSTPRRTLKRPPPSAPAADRSPDAHRWPSRAGRW